ncbi:CRISPR-associated helicase Cas3' [Neptuniibacter marinus]|uniref:CRISPR-associated helicase Cas3' n=1 Tax=Neptuniibacter marinus TaxID=1806670 RepID=UPI003B5A3636
MTSIPPYMQYWGKAKKAPDNEGADYHLLPYHCLDVAAVGKLLLDADRPLTNDIAKFLDISSEELQSVFLFFLALHDLGKFSSAFQALYQSNSPDLLQVGRCKPYDGQFYRHDRLGFYFWNDIEKQGLMNALSLKNLQREELYHTKQALRVLVDVVLGHHGQPINSEAVRSIKPFTEKVNGIAAMSFFEAIFELLKPVFPITKMQFEPWRERLKQVSWQLAGIAVLADWIGSDSSYFCYQSEAQPLHEYWEKAQSIAVEALNSTDLNKAPIVSPFISIKKHYGFDPTPLQRWAETVDVDDSPQLFILEDITGAGKTEAALALTHRLMQKGAADGFYFGLPTMATSNAMFSRVAQHYQQMLSVDEGKVSIVLAHGARDMNDMFREAVLSSDNPDTEYDANDITATAQCNHWLSDSRKKALLAPVGVGTIDQALLAVLPRRHQSLRLIGLNRKVLIFDEIHAADEFMFELLESLLSMHFHQGGSVILLTATLSFKQRSRLVNIWQQAAGVLSQAPKSRAFPLATRVALNAKPSLLEQPLASRIDVTREIGVRFLHTFDACVAKVMESVTNQQCVVWVRNSVDDALEAYQVLQQQLDHTDDCLLFHSRFILQDRKSTEDKVLSIFGKNSDARSRAGKVLIATQVFQESLDADADVLISDICPIDDLIQRAGRLHRHTRNDQGLYCRDIIDERDSPVLWIHSPEWDDAPSSDWLSQQFRNTQYVYRSPGRLWLGLRELIALGAVRMPADARQLVEAVYSDAAYEQIPDSLLNQENTLIGEERSKAAKAHSQLIDWQYGYRDHSAFAWHDDNSDISTRYSDIETVEVLLLKRDLSGSLIPYADGTKVAIQLSTLKLSKNKYADKLQAIPENEEDAFKVRFRKTKYLQCWLPDEDSHFSYDSKSGFVEKNKRKLL